MGRHDLLDPSDTQYFNTETIWNEITRERLASNTKRAIHVVNLDKQGNHAVPGGSVGGVTQNREVTLADDTAVKIEPTSGATEMHLINDMSTKARYGGTGVTDTSGGILFNQAILIIKNPSSDFDIYFIQKSGESKTLDVVEFF